MTAARSSESGLSALLLATKRLAKRQPHIVRAVQSVRTWLYLRQYASPKIIRAFAKAYPEAVFVQIGSNDGEQLDPLRAAILTRRWRGIMVEPVPYVFDRLSRNYGRFAGRIALENVAIAEEGGMLPFYHLRRVDDYAAEGLPQWYDALGSFNRDVVLKHVNYIPDIAQRLVQVNVPSITFDSLCRRHGIEQIDLLHTDVEGYDYQLLKTIDFGRFRPRLLIYERHHMNDAQRAECETLVASAGYDCLSEGMDTWCLNLRDTTARDRGLVALWHRLKATSNTEQT